MKIQSSLTHCSSSSSLFSSSVVHTCFFFLFLSLSNRCWNPHCCCDCWRKHKLWLYTHCLFLLHFRRLVSVDILASSSDHWDVCQSLLLLICVVWNSKCKSLFLICSHSFEYCHSDLILLFFRSETLPREREGKSSKLSAFLGSFFAFSKSLPSFSSSIATQSQHTKTTMRQPSMHMLNVSTPISLCVSVLLLVWVPQVWQLG